jgi:hypothetical protein
MWSSFLIFLGALSVASAAVGVIAWAVAVEGGWETLGVILFGGPIVLLLAAWPVALGQALRAIADIGDAVVLRSSEPAAV